MEEVELTINEQFKRDIMFDIYFSKESYESLFILGVSTYSLAGDYIPLFAYLWNMKVDDKIAYLYSFRRGGHIYKKDIKSHLNFMSIFHTRIDDKFLYQTYIEDDKIQAGIFVSKEAFLNKTPEELEVEDFYIIMSSKIQNNRNLSQYKRFYNDLLKKYPNLNYMVLNKPELTIQPYGISIDEYLEFSVDNMSYEEEEKLYANLSDDVMSGKINITSYE